MHITPQMIALGVGAVALFAVLAFRLQSMTRQSAFNPNRAMIYPVILVVFAGLFIWRTQPQGVEWAWLAVASALGAGLGWLRASTVRMSVDPTTNTLMAQAGATAILFLVGLLAIRYALRLVLTEEAGALGLRLVMADVIFAAMGASLFAARSVEMVLRGRKLLAIHAANPIVVTSEAAGI